MSSIVYITDRDMIEYHRLNGDKTMNFWRPGSLKKMLDFYPGDLLFFLSKGTERGIKREKGIVGYGRYVESRTMSMKNMWKTYGTENGYPTESKFYEAVDKVKKNKDQKTNMSSLFLSNCVYFQSPIYLSEIDVNVSNMVESYFYLDKNDSEATTKILNKAKEVGLDTWMSVINGFEDDTSSIEEESTRHIVSDIINKCCPIYDEDDTKKAIRICKKMMEELKKEGSNVEYVKGNKETFMCLDDNRLEIFVPLVSTNKELNKKIQYIIGHATVIKNLLKKHNFLYTTEITIIIENKLSLEQQELIHAGNISYLYLKTNNVEV